MTSGGRRLGKLEKNEVTEQSGDRRAERWGATIGGGRKQQGGIGTDCMQMVGGE